MNQFDTIYFGKYVWEGDELLFVCHRHPILIIDTIILWCFFGVLLPIFFYLQNTFGILEIISTGYIDIFLILVYLCLVYHVFDWYNDVWVITNRGIVDVQWRYFTGDLKYIEYENIHGIEVKSDSIFDPILGKGDILIRLVSEWDEFFLSDAVNPQGIVEYMQAVIDEMRHEHDRPVDNRAPFDLLMDTLTDMVREHLQKGGNRSAGTDETSAEEARIMERAMRRRGTIDLRSDQDMDTSEPEPYRSKYANYSWDIHNGPSTGNTRHGNESASGHGADHGGDHGGGGGHGGH